MGLFGKREDCAICGGKVKGIFPMKIDGHPICNECFGETDVPPGWIWGSVENFKTYYNYRAENQKLASGFKADFKFETGAFEDKPVLDYGNHLYCPSKNLDKTIFKAGEMTDFTISEDDNVIFCCNADKFERCESAIPESVERLRTSMPGLIMEIMKYEYDQEDKRRAEKLAKEQGKEAPARTSLPKPSIPVPFRRFRISMNFNHPYWKNRSFDMAAPKFDEREPDVNDYLMQYNTKYQEMLAFANAMARAMFPNAKIDSAQTTQTVQTSEPALNDTVAQLRQFKQLLDDGIISEADYEAKKKQLLGI